MNYLACGSILDIIPLKKNFLIVTKKTLFFFLDKTIMFQVRIFQWLDMGWLKKKLTINVKKKYTKKWRWPHRELKIWHMCNHIIVNILTKNIFFMLLYITDMAIWMSNFDNFDIDQKPSEFAQR